MSESDFTQGFHAGCCEAARMLREAANDHTQVAETSRKVLDKQANELAAAILLSWTNGIEMTANRVASGKSDPNALRVAAASKAPENDLAQINRDLVRDYNVIASDNARLDEEVRLWKRISNERSEQMQQLNLDRAAMGVENMQLREALQRCAECDPECAMFAARALSGVKS